MEFLALSVFCEAASAGSLASAARRLRIAPMSATRSLAALEKELGVRLMHRTTRSLTLTDEGQAFLSHAQAILEEREAALASIRPAAAGAAGTLRLTASSAFGRKVVAPALATFMNAHPALKVDLLLSDSLIDLVSEGLDLGIRIAALGNSDLVASPLADNPRGLFAAPDYLNSAGTPTCLAELGAHECLTISGTSHWTFTKAGRPVSTKVTGRFRANTIEGIHRACVAGLGLARLSRWDVAAELACGALQEIHLDDADLEPLTIWAVYPTRRLLPTKVRLFVKHLKEILTQPISR